MLSKLKQELDTGKNMQFGSVTINKNGVQWKNKNYPWLDLAQAGLANGMVHYVPKKRNLFSGIHIPMQEVSNFDVLLTLSNDLIKQNRQSTAH